MSRQVRLVIGLAEDLEWVTPAIVRVDPVTSEYWGDPEDYYFSDGFDISDIGDALSEIQTAFELPVLKYPEDFADA